MIYKRNTLRRANQKKHTRKKKRQERKEKITVTGRGYKNIDCHRFSPEFCTNSQINGTAWPHAPTARILFFRNKSRGWFPSFPIIRTPPFASALTRWETKREKKIRKKKREKTNTESAGTFFEIDMSCNAKNDAKRDQIDYCQCYAHALLEKK